MTTLEKINGEALAVPGLRFWGHAKHGRIAIIAQDQRGAVLAPERGGGVRALGDRLSHRDADGFGKDTLL